MLKLKDYRTRAKGLPDLLSYAALVAPGVILNKDGSFLAAWEIRGQDTASSTPDELAFVSAQFNNAIRLLGTGWMLHVDSIRSSHRAYPAPEKGHFPDPITLLIDDERRAYFSGNRCFSTSTVFSVTYKPNFGAAQLSMRTAGKVQAGQRQAPFWKKPWDSFKTPWKNWKMPCLPFCICSDSRNMRRILTMAKPIRSLTFYPISSTVFPAICTRCECRERPCIWISFLPAMIWSGE